MDFLFSMVVSLTLSFHCMPIVGMRYRIQRTHRIRVNCIYVLGKDAGPQQATGCRVSGESEVLRGFPTVRWVRVWAPRPSPLVAQGSVAQMIELHILAMTLTFWEKNYIRIGLHLLGVSVLWETLPASSSSPLSSLPPDSSSASPHCPPPIPVLLFDRKALYRLFAFQCFGLWHECKCPFGITTAYFT